MSTGWGIRIHPRSDNTCQHDKKQTNSHFIAIETFKEAWKSNEPFFAILVNLEDWVVIFFVVFLVLCFIQLGCWLLCLVGE
jgi:ABC-type sugar transport system permease subunit